jgi:hypothetical protein
MKLYKRFVFIALISCLTMQAYGQTAPSSAIEKFKQSWVAKALKLQREIDLNAPLSEATFIGTHNSENSSSYAIPFLRYVDPNQTLSMYDQLELGVRSLELDVHWTLGLHSKKELLLSHGHSNHAGCSRFDRPLVEGLKEMQAWLKANPNEVVLLYLDREIEGHEPQTIFEINEYLGGFIFKPTQVRTQLQMEPVCTSLPGSMTKAHILNAGKQLILVTKNCDGFFPDYHDTDKFKLAWNDYVFAGIGKPYRNPFTIIDSTMRGFDSYPDCGYRKTFSDDATHTSMWRIFEDRTILSNLTEHQPRLLAADMKELIRCGINWPTMDMLSVDDDRLTAAIWSWSPSYPIDGKGQCAIYKKGEGIQNLPCEENVSGYACLQEKSNEWKAIDYTGVWRVGEKSCQMILGEAWHFGAPINGKQMYNLKNALQLPSVWLNYSSTEQGVWRVKGEV